MSAELTWAVIVGGLFVIAAVWIAVTQRPSRPSEPEPEPEPEPLTVRLRPMGEPFAHRFRVAEVHADLPDVEALAYCGRWRVAELAPDEAAPSCVPCERAAEGIEGRGSG